MCRYAQSGFLDPDGPIRKYTKKERADLLYREPTKIKINDINLTYEGLVPRIQKSMLSKDPGGMQPHIRTFAERAVTFTACPECDGTRLSAAARSSRSSRSGSATSRSTGPPGQPLTTLSGGERQSLELATHMAHADWSVDLGPGAGRDGGRVVFEGTPEPRATPGRPGSCRT